MVYSLLLINYSQQTFDFYFFYKLQTLPLFKSKVFILSVLFNLRLFILKMELKDFLQDIIEGVSNTYGKEFFHQITLQLNKVIGADYTFIARLDKGSHTATTIALINKGKIGDNMSYSLEDTPCANVADDSICTYPDEITTLFPKDQLLIDMKIKGYIGTPLYDSKGQVMGLIVALYENPIQDEADTTTLFQIFSGRIAAEIERSEYEQQLENYNQKLEHQVQERTKELETAHEELLASNEELQSQTEELAVTLTNLQQSQEKLIEAEKMASLGILSAGVAHEINNPLNFIQGGLLGLTDYFKQKELNKEEIEPFLYAINEGVQRASTIVKSLNHFSRKGKGFNDKCNIHDILENCLVILHNQTKHHIEIEKDFTNEECMLKGNESKLHQVFLNLITNAIQSIEEYGKIILKTKVIDQQIQIAITDTGCGIPECAIKEIYNPFFTTKEPGKGTGLGLSITYNIIQEHKGDINVESEAGKGTTFCICLPIHDLNFQQQEL